LDRLDYQENGKPLSSLQRRSIGNYKIQLYLKPLQYRGGWTYFSLYLEDQGGRISSQKRSRGEWVDKPVLEGIHSRGGRGVKGWIEVGDYFPIVHFKGRGLPPKAVLLSREGLDQEIFHLLGECVPPGGHLMFAYEVSYESPLHWETQETLMKGFPPVSTAQGGLLFRAGFRLVKDWYLSEGGHEGPRKLWGEKPINEVESRGFDVKTFLQLVAFLSRKPNQTCIERERLTRRRALEILEELDLEPNLSTLRQAIIHIYQKGFRPKVLGTPAHHVCNQIREMLKNSHFEDEHIRGKLSEIASNCSGGMQGRRETQGLR
jgi:hypothetical protein